jgi:hypothetical protein
MVKKKIGLNIRFLYVFIDVEDEELLILCLLLNYFLKILYNNIQKI